MSADEDEHKTDARKRAAETAAEARRKAEFILSRAFGLVKDPKQEWDEIRREETNVASILFGYVAPLAAVMPICEVLGQLVFGGMLAGALGVAIVRAALTFVMSVVAVFLMGLMINAAAPNFDAERNDLMAQKVAAYAMTPYLLSGLFWLWPPIWWLSMLAIGYAVYLIYVGLPLLMKAPEDRALSYASTVAVAGVVAFIILFGVAGAVTGPGGL